jgi:hypothetical protein
MAILPAHAMRAAGVCVAGVITCAATPADAAFSLQIDVNSLTAEFSPSNGAGFGENASGFIMLGEDGNSTLNGIKLDQIDQGIAPGQLWTFSGVIELTNGTVVGGSLDIILTDGSRYGAFFSEGSGRVIEQAGQGFAIDGLTFSGAFFGLVNGTDFGGVDVSDLGFLQLPGSFLTFAFDPDGQGVDTDTDIDIWIVPAPTTAAIFGLAGLAAARRRRA